MARVAKLRLIDIETLMINMKNYQYEFSWLNDFKDLVRVNDYLNGLEKNTNLKKYFLKNKARKAEQKERTIISCPVCYNKIDRKSVV